MRRKPIQHLEGGIVKDVLVKEAQAVRQDQVLFRLEPTQARANSDMLRKQPGAVLAPGREAPRRARRKTGDLLPRRDAGGQHDSGNRLG